MAPLRAVPAQNTFAGTACLVINFSAGQEDHETAATNQRQQIDHGQRVCESSIWLVRNSVALREHWLWRPADGACSSGPTTRKKRDAKLMSSVAVLAVER